jgi:non-heme chloroperoxidase
MSALPSFDGTSLAVTSTGPTDGSPVVLVHGLGLSADSWGEVPALLTDRHQVIRYDLRGHGGSGSAGPAGYELRAHARDLAQVLRSCVPDGRRAVVVGHSLGGGIILAAARETDALDRTAGVVFAGSGGSGVTAPGLPVRGLPPALGHTMRRGWFGVLRATTRLGRTIRPAQWLSDRMVRRIGVGPTAPQEVVAHVRDSFLTTRAPALSATTLASLSSDGLELAPFLAVPTLVLHGSADPEVAEDELRELLDALPDGERVEFPDAGHMLPLTHPTEVAEEIARWARRVQAA